MALEVSTYINGLNGSNPVKSSDIVSEGVDHLQLLKNTIKNTFPNVSNAISASHYDLSSTTIVTSAGTSSAYTATITPSAAFTLQAGVGFVMKPNVACAANPTLNVNGSGAKNLITKDNVNLVANQLLTTAYYHVVYNGTAYVVCEAENSLIYGTKKFNGEVISTNANSFRIVQGNYGTFWRNDGLDFWLMLTDSGDQYGNFNSLRPFNVNLSTGAVVLQNSAFIYSGAIISGGLTVNGGSVLHHGTTINNGAEINGSVTVNEGATINGGVNIASGNMLVGAGDVYTYSSSNAGHGTLFLGNSFTKYLKYDGTNYILPNANLHINSKKAVTVANNSYSDAYYVPKFVGKFTSLTGSIGWTGSNYNGSAATGSRTSAGNYSFTFPGISSIINAQVTVFDTVDNMFAQITNISSNVITVDVTRYSGSGTDPNNAIFVTVYGA